jgi:hypothetical protein
MPQDIFLGILFCLGSTIYSNLALALDKLETPLFIELFKLLSRPAALFYFFPDSA